MDKEPSTKTRKLTLPECCTAIIVAIEEGKPFGLLIQRAYAIEFYQDGEGLWRVALQAHFDSDLTKLANSIGIKLSVDPENGFVTGRGTISSLPGVELAVSFT